MWLSHLMGLTGNSFILRNTLGCSSGFGLLRRPSVGNINCVVTIGRNHLLPITTNAVSKKQHQQSKSWIRGDKYFSDRSTATAKRQEVLESQQPSVQNHITGQSISDTTWPAVFIAFDLETTGFCHRKERIIEVAFRDLLGGRNSTLQTLVNPEREVNLVHIHGITTKMVNNPNVPRMKELIPILLEYVERRRMDGKPVVFIAHNACRFDVPFLKEEFHRCSFEFPSDWLFIDTLHIARDLKKDGKLSLNLKALREYYGISLEGPAHRAMQDVSTLCLVLQKMSFDLKLTLTDLMKYTFRP